MPKTPEVPAHLIDPETGEINTALLDLEEAMVQRANYLNEDGSENPDPTPIAPPIGYNRQPSLVEQMRAMIRDNNLAQALAAQGYETFEDSDDFDIPDDPIDPSSPWEGEFEPIADITADEAAKNAAAKARKTPAAEPPPAPAEQPPEAAPAASAAPPKPSA